MGIPTDVLYPEVEQRQLVEGLPDARYARIVSPHGHDAFLIEFPQVAAHLRRFLISAPRRDADAAQRAASAGADALRGRASASARLGGRGGGASAAASGDPPSAAEALGGGVGLLRSSPMTRPSNITRMRSARLMTSLRSADTSSTARPSSRARRSGGG
jgi:hypothetical protein